MKGHGSSSCKIVWSGGGRGDKVGGRGRENNRELSGIHKMGMGSQGLWDERAWTR